VNCKRSRESCQSYIERCTGSTLSQPTNLQAQPGAPRPPRAPKEITPHISTHQATPLLEVVLAEEAAAASRARMLEHERATTSAVKQLRNDLKDEKGDAEDKVCGQGRAEQGRAGYPMGGPTTALLLPCGLRGAGGGTVAASSAFS
jgi:hypothetical protein